MHTHKQMQCQTPDQDHSASPGITIPMNTKTDSTLLHHDMCVTAMSGLLSQAPPTCKASCIMTMPAATALWCVPCQEFTSWLRVARSRITESTAPREESLLSSGIRRNVRKRSAKPRKRDGSPLGTLRSKVGSLYIN